MILTKEQKQALEERNKNIISDFQNNVPVPKIAKKYKLKVITIYYIVRGFTRIRNDEECELTEAEQRLREKYRNFDLANEIGKGLKIQWWDLGITAQPKNRGIRINR